jgi:nucleoporin NUP42
MKHDLTGQRPIYPLSCYGPGRDAPRQLIEGPVEISPEELRVRYYAQRLEGNEPGAVSTLVVPALIPLKDSSNKKRVL